MKQNPLSKTETLENLFLLMWGSILSVLLFIYLYGKYKEYTKKNALPARINPSFFKEPKKKAEEADCKKKRLKQFRIKDSYREEEPFQLTLIQVKQIEDTPTRNKKAEKRRNSDASTIPPVLFSHPLALPAEIRFSDKYVFPSPPDAPYAVYPLPGQEKSDPVARVTMNGHVMFIHNTQFGVLTARDFSDESQVQVHQRSLENGQVVFAKDIRLFKTHPIGTAGDVRVCATHQITTENGLTLHLFDLTIQHAHRGK